MPVFPGRPPSPGAGDLPGGKTEPRRRSSRGWRAKPAAVPTWQPARWRLVQGVAVAAPLGRAAPALTLPAPSRAGGPVCHGPAAQPQPPPGRAARQPATAPQRGQGGRRGACPPRSEAEAERAGLLEPRAREATNQSPPWRGDQAFRGCGCLRRIPYFRRGKTVTTSPRFPVSWGDSERCSTPRGADLCASASPGVGCGGRRKTGRRDITLIV